MDKFFSIKDIFKDKWLVIAIFFGLIIRMIYISEPVKYDEASSFLGYIESPNILRLFWYNTTNNHVTGKPFVSCPWGSEHLYQSLNSHFVTSKVT